MQAARDSIDLAQYETDKRRLAERGDGDDARARAQDAFAFFFQADHETGLVDKINDGQMKRIAELDEPDRLLAAVLIERAALVRRIIHHHADGITVHAAEARDSRLAE